MQQQELFDTTSEPMSSQNLKKKERLQPAKVYTIEDDDEYIYDIGIEFNRDTSSYTINIMQFDKISGRLIHRCDMSINKKGLDHLVNHLMKALLYP